MQSFVLPHDTNTQGSRKERKFLQCDRGHYTALTADAALITGDEEFTPEIGSMVRMLRFAIALEAPSRAIRRGMGGVRVWRDDVCPRLPITDDRSHRRYVRSFLKDRQRGVRAGKLIRQSHGYETSVRENLFYSYTLARNNLKKDLRK